MAKIIELPKLSPTMEEGTLVRWAKNEGDAVEIDDLLAEVETDKATMEFRAFDKGTLLKRLVAEGATAKLGQPVAIFGSPGEDVSALAGQGGGGAKAGEATAKSEATEPKGDAPKGDAPKGDAPKGDAPKGDEAKGDAREAPPATTAARAPAPRGPRAPAANAIASTAGLAGIVLLPTKRADADAAGEPGGPSTPRIRKMALERGIDLDRVRGTGPHGRVTARDLDQAPRGTTAGQGSVSAAPAEDTVKPASQMRKTIARRLTEAKRDVPHFYLEADLDVEALLAMREQINDGVEKDQKVSVTDLMLRACALALREVPASNASWIDGSIAYHNRVDISVAVAIDDGLLTPVVRDVDRKTVRTIGAEVRDLAARARARKLKPEEMQGGVFSLSNLGMYGIDRFSAVINPPEGMILAVGASRDTPVVRDGQVVAGKRCAVTLSCDHRVVDGAVGAQYLKALRALIERPIKLLA